MAAGLVVLVNVVFGFLAVAELSKQVAAISVSPETNTKPKKMKLYNIGKRRKTPEYDYPGNVKMLCILFNSVKKRTLKNARCEKHKHWHLHII